MENKTLLKIIKGIGFTNLVGYRDKLNDYHEEISYIINLNNYNGSIIVEEEVLFNFVKHIYNIFENSKSLDIFILYKNIKNNLIEYGFDIMMDKLIKSLEDN